MHKTSCLLRVNALRDSLKSAERRLADYILNSPEDVLASTVKALEAKSGVSYATIIRFCRKVEFSGFKEFKRHLAEDLKSVGAHIEPVGFPLEAHDTPSSISGKVLASSIRTLEETVNIVDMDALEKAAEALSRATRIVCCGTGTSGLSAHYAYGRLFRLGIACHQSTDPTLYKMLIATLGKGDVVFAISSSGRSASVVEAARLAQTREATVISLCDFAISPLSKTADINLYTTPRNVGQYTNIEMPLIIGQVAIIDILFACCATRMGEDALQVYASTKTIGDQEKLRNGR